MKNGISRAALASLKSIAVCRVPPATGTPTRVAKYAARSLRNSKSRTRNSPSAAAKVNPAASRSMTMAPASVSFAKAASMASVTGCGVGTNGSKPLRPTRVRPIRAPLRPFGSTNCV
ncbi:MAG: hypothetical protein E6H49_00980 [Betaproteobacteria bacterium]|nr:MAG: hypothetical protein E6H49_00980 [Betaproteobacteria bacterium]